MIINGLHVPPLLLEAIRTKRWKVPHNLEKLYHVFSEVNIIHPLFYAIDMLIAENAEWVKETDEMYIGTSDEYTPPGDIDPSQSLLIGDLGPDNCIALDFRLSLVNPSVVYLTGDERAKWIMVAPDFQSLLKLLEL